MKTREGREIFNALKKKTRFLYLLKFSFKFEGAVKFNENDRVESSKCLTIHGNIKNTKKCLSILSEFWKTVKGLH